MKPKNCLRVQTVSNNQEWYTPPDVTDRVLQVFGRIDLDPCAPEVEQFRTVPAINYYTAKDNGLSRAWGRRLSEPQNGQLVSKWEHPFNVFVNPPWNNLAEWTLWALAQYNQGYCTGIIMLVPARTETKWFQRMKQATMCLPNHRIKYLKQSSSGGALLKPSGGLEPSALFYLGPDPAKFAHFFTRDNWGRVYTCVS